MTWTAAAHPRFGGLPIGSAKTLCGVKAASREQLEAGVASGKILQINDTDGNMPESFDSAAHWPQCATVINDIRDQSACGEHP